MGDFMASVHPAGDQRHPAVTMMNEMGYDAGTIGNHEFNFGLEFLTRTTEGARFPIVLANAATELGNNPTEDRTLYPPYTLLERQILDERGVVRPIKIGVIGFVPPQVSIWERRHLNNRVHLRGIVETAKAYVSKMKAEGADIVVALSHSGIAAANAPLASENASLQLATIKGIDVILCGHQHKRFPSPDFDGIDGVDARNGTLHGIPAVMPGHWGAELGMVDLFMTYIPDTGWQVTSHQVYLERGFTDTMAGLPKEVAAAHQATLDYIRQPVAETKQSLHTHFTYLGFDLATRAIAIAQRDRAATLLGQTDIPILSAASPFRAGGHTGPDYFTEVNKGTLTIRDMADLYLFPNTLSVMRVTGAELQDWLERSAGKFRQIQQGKTDQPALTQGFPSYNFDMILGVDYEIDPTQPARYSVDGRLENPGATRIRNLSYKGRGITAKDSFLIATNSYRAGGGGQVPGGVLGAEILSTQEEIRTIVMDHFRKAKVANIDPALNWRFTKMSDTSMLFPISPKARPYLSELPIPITPINRDEGGFNLYRLDL